MTEREIEDAKLRIGREIERFQTGELGKTMLDLSAMRGHQALAAFKNVNPHNPEKIMELQNEIECGDRFVEYMNELLEEAESVMVRRAEEEADD